MMASVTDAIAELGIEIIHIPGGCTGLTQPLDVGINMPFKSRVRVLWEEWMIDEIDRTGLVYAPTREDISGWVAEVVWGLNGKKKDGVQLVFRGRGGGQCHWQCQ
jgi:hypothetical protein